MDGRKLGPSFLGHKDYGGLLETCRYYRLDQGEVENIREDTCQLVCACFEYTSLPFVGVRLPLVPQIAKFIFFVMIKMMSACFQSQIIRANGSNE
jgi:hypothetical protein